MWLLWVEIGTLLVAQIVCGALALVAVGFGRRQPLSLIFALFTGIEALWFMMAILMRLSLAVGAPELLLLELNVAAFAPVGPLLLLFAARLHGAGARWAGRAAWAGLAVNLALYVPLFSGRLVSNMRVLPSGAMGFDVTPAAKLLGVVPLLALLGAAALFWRLRRRTGPTLFWSTALLILAYLFRLAEIRIPAMPFVYTASAVLLGFWVARSQFFNPLREQNERLEREVAVRARTEAELEARNAELERFAYTVSHDLKSPLITVRGYLGHVGRAAASGDLGRLREDLARIADATDRMQRLLDELLELSRAGRQARPPEPVALGPVVEEALRLTAGSRAGRGIEVVVAPVLPTVLGDPTRLVEVFQNLLDNAAKFMGGQPRPRVEIGVRAQAGEPMPVLFVADNGAGIEPRHHERVFGLFDKLDPASEGTGVGLALVRRIVETHGGRIWVESAGAGAGSAFCFTLPPAGAERRP